MTHKTQPTAHAEITAPISADLRRIDGSALRHEYRATMPVDVLHLWAKDAIACIQELEAQAAAKWLHRADAAHDPALEKPEAGRYVLAWTEGAKVPIRAMWAPQFFLEMADDDAESGEYCEAKDQYFCPEGWYENNAHEETHWNVDRPVIAWMELPRIDAALRAAPPAPAAVAAPDLRLTDEQIEQAFISARDEFMLREVERTDKKLRLAFARAVLHSARAALAAAPAQPAAWMTPEGDRVVTEATMASARKDGGAMLSSLRPFTVALARAAAPAQEHATQLAGQRQDLIGMAETWEQSADDAEACKSERSQPDYKEGLVAGMRQCAADLRAAAPAQAQEDACPVLDDEWKRRMLDGRALVRDDMGCGYHPALPTLDEGMNPKQFFEALGIQLAGSMADGEMDMDAYDAMVEATDYNVWTPGAPDGEGWALVAIFDTEDGPAAWWIREAAPKQPARRGRKSAHDAALPSWWPDFIQSVTELPDRNSPEDEPDAMVATADELGTCAINAIDAARAAQGGA